MTIQDYQDLVDAKNSEIKFLHATLNKFREENEKLKRDKDNWKGMYNNACLLRSVDAKFRRKYESLKTEHTH
jgi:hypothetical protein